MKFVFTLTRQNVDETRQHRPGIQIRRALPHRKVAEKKENFVIKLRAIIVFRLNSALEEMLTTSMGICQTRKELFGQLFEELIRQEMIACKVKRNFNLYSL